LTVIIVFFLKKIHKLKKNSLRNTNFHEFQTSVIVHWWLCNYFNLSVNTHTLWLLTVTVALWRQQQNQVKCNKLCEIHTIARSVKRCLHYRASTSCRHDVIARRVCMIV